MNNNKNDRVIDMDVPDALDKVVDSMFDDYKNIHVYCVDCKHFHIIDKDIPYCLFEHECDIRDCEDSRTLLERPHYRAKPM